MDKKLYRKDFVFISILLSIFILIALTSTRQKSLTADEGAYIASANAFYYNADYSINVYHPPLIKQFFSIPSIFLNANFPAQSKYIKEKNAILLGNEFLFESNNDADKIIFWTRFVNIVLATILGLFVFIFALKLFGKRGAYISLVIYILTPEIIAHSSLATLDIGNALFIFLTLFAFWRLLEHPSLRNYLFLLISFSFAILTKHTSFLLIPAVVVLYISLKIKKQTHKLDSWYSTDITKINKYKLISTAIVILFSLIFIFAIIWADYGFEFGPAKSINMIVPVPSYINGINLQLKHSEQGGITYFFGETSTTGSMFYFLAAFLVKTPLPILLLFFTSIFLLRKEQKLYFILVPIVILFLYFSLINNIFIGLRYILPIYPLIALSIGSIGNSLSSPKLRYLFIVLFCWLAVSIALTYPNYLSYFNEFVGSNSQKYLADSNIDWGQDLILLKNHIEKNSIQNIAISYWGADSLKYRNLEKYAILCEWDTNNYYINGEKLQLKDLKDKSLFISVNNIYLLDNKCWRFLKNKKPGELIGGSIFYFNMSSTIAST